ncbi:MAG: single-stranded DNA-binding protein [Dehalococcoidia bacterium]|nr:single-stranded DNA-binding protein [Dehalococcoidia bacterium]
MDLNKVMIIGNVGREPEMRFTANGTAVTTFTVAVNRVGGGQDNERREETEWFRIVTWEKLAENCNQYVSKGKRLYVEGRLQTRSWEGNDGQKRYTTELVASNVIFLDRRDPSGAAGEEVSEDIEPDDLPF